MPASVLELLNAERYLHELWRLIDLAKRRMAQLENIKWLGAA